MNTALFWWHFATAGLAPIVARMTWGALIIAGLLAFVFLTPAWLLPRLKKWCIVGAVCFAFAMIGFVTGGILEKRRMELQQQVVLENNLADADKARAAADTGVSDCTGFCRLHYGANGRPDPYDRAQGQATKLRGVEANQLRQPKGHGPDSQVRPRP